MGDDHCAQLEHPARDVGVKGSVRFPCRSMERKRTASSSSKRRRRKRIICVVIDDCSCVQMETSPRPCSVRLIREPVLVEGTGIPRKQTQGCLCDVVDIRDPGIFVLEWSAFIDLQVWAVERYVIMRVEDLSRLFNLQCAASGRRFGVYQNCRESRASGRCVM